MNLIQNYVTNINLSNKLKHKISFIKLVYFKVSNATTLSKGNLKVNNSFSSGYYLN